MGRTAQMILGIIGGIIALIGSFLAMAAVAVVGGVAAGLQNVSGDAAAAAQTTSQASGFVGQTGLAMLAAIVGIVGAAWVRSKPKRGAYLMIASAVVGSIFAGLFYILGGILLAIAGIMALLQKEEKAGGKK